jgi:protein gp37
MHPDWARAIRDQCAAAGVAFFFKQNGEWQHMPERAHFKEQFREEWRLVESGIPGVRPALMFRVGKKRAGRLLDGYTHDDMPGSRATL